MAPQRTGSPAGKQSAGTRLAAVLVSVALVLMTAVGAFVLPQTTPPAQAATEQTAGVTLNITSNRGMIGASYANNAKDDTTNQDNDWACFRWTTYFDGSRACTQYQKDTIRYGLIQGKSAYSGSPERSSMTQQFWVTGAQKAQDMWSYVARGVPYKGRLGTYIQVDTQSSIGFQANTLTTVQANEPFLIGTMRHNNYPISTENTWLHSSLSLDFNGVTEEFPFVQEETSNNTYTMVVKNTDNHGTAKSVDWSYCGRGLSGYYYEYTYTNGVQGSAVCFQNVPDGGDYDLYTDSNYYTYKDGNANQTPASDDQVTIQKVNSENIVIVKDGVPYRLKLLGFYNNGTSQKCSATPTGGAGDTVTYFRTKEGQDTFGCLYGEFEQERYVTITKKTTADANSQNVTVPAFSFTTDADSQASYFYDNHVTNDTSLFAGATKQIDGVHAGFINDNAFTNTLKPTTAAGSGGTDDYDLANGTQTGQDAYYAFGVGSSGFKITEQNPDTSANRTKSGWKLTDITCVNGKGEDVAVSTNLNAGSVDFSKVGAVTDAKAVPIRCTFTNRYEAKSTLTLKKAVSGGTAAASSWTLTGTGTDAVTSKTVVSGAGNSDQVTSAVVPSGDYSLTEALNNQNVYGYELTGLTCRNAAGTVLTMTNADGDATNLAEKVTLAPDANVTCTFTNTYKTGRIAARKVLTGSTEGLKDDGQTFDFTYTCNSGQTGDITGVKAGGDAVLASAAIPIGATCSITEKDASIAASRLVNSSYKWATPTYSTPVTVTSANTATAPAVLTVTNTITQDTGVLQLAKTVKPDNGVQAGYTGGTTRTFPLTYTCTLDGQTVAQGTKDVTANGQSVQVEVPAGAACTVTEPKQTVQAGDFSASYYDWSTTTYTGNGTTVGEGETKSITVTNTYKIVTVPLTVKKTVVGPDGTQASPGTSGYLSSAADYEFTVTYTCGPVTGTLKVKNGQTATVQVPRQTSCLISEDTSSLSEDALSADFDWDMAQTRYEDTNGAALASQSVAVGTTGGTGVVVNPTKRSFGGIAIAKTVTDTTGLTSDARFTYSVQCYAPGVDPQNPGGAQTTYTNDAVTIALGEVWRMPEDTVPAGSNCLVTETSPTAGTSDGFTDSSYAWTTTSWRIQYGQEHNNTGDTGRSTVITAHAKSTADKDHPYPRVTFTNNFERKYVTLQVSKMIDLSKVDLTSIDAQTYTGTFTCYLGSEAMLGTWSQSRDGGTGQDGVATLTLTTNGQGIDQTSADTLTLFRGSWCQVQEDSPSARPYAADAHYIWGAPSISPGTVTWSQDQTAQTVIVTNPVQKTEANLLISKAVSGGEEGSQFETGTTFDFQYQCWTDATKAEKVTVNGVTAEGTRSITAGTTAELADVTLPAGAYCELFETTDAKHGIKMDPWIWDPVRYTNATSTGETRTVGQGADAVTTPVVAVTVPADGSSVTVQANNHLNNRLTEVKVSKVVTGETAGLASDVTFTFNVTCTPEPGSLVAGYSGTVQATVPKGSTTATVSTGKLVPVGQHCSVTESPASGGLVDDSYAWGTPTYAEVTHGEGKTPAVVTADIDGAAELKVTNPTERVYGAVGLVKSIAGEGAAASQGRTATYSGTFTCTYNGAAVTAVGTGTWTVTGPGRATVKAEDGTDLSTGNSLLPLGSVCAPSGESINGAPNTDDPQYRWQNGDGAPAYGNATVHAEARADMTVTNTVEQKHVPAELSKTVVDENGNVTTDILKDATQSFAITVQCAPDLAFDNMVTVHRELASGQTYDRDVPSGWFCRMSEDSPSDDWLKDSSYTWKTPTITVLNGDTPLAAVDGQPGVYQLTDDVTDLKVQVTNSVDRVTGPISLTKSLTPQAQGAVKDATAAFNGRYTCTYAGATISAGTWSAAPGGTAIFTEDAVYLLDSWTPARNGVDATGGLPLTTSCSFNETAPTSDSLKNASWAWTPPVLDRGTADTPVTITSTTGAHTVTVTNDVTQVYSTLKVVKDLSEDTNVASIADGSSVGVQLVCTDPNGGRDIAQGFGLNARGNTANAADPTLSTVTVDGTVQTVNGTQVTTVHVPAGAACTIAEDTLFTKVEKPDSSQLADTSWAWDTETYTSQLGSAAPVTQDGTWSVATSADEVLTLTVTNRTHRVYGSVDVEKIVPDATTTDTNTYAGRWTCTDEAGATYSGAWTRVGSGSASLQSDQDYDGDGVRNNHVPVGSSCTVTETDRPDQPNASDPSYEWMTALADVPVGAVNNAVDATHSKVATTGSNASLTVTNDQTRHFGSFTITKQVAGATDGADADGKYAVNYTCTSRSGESVSGLVWLKAGAENTVTVGDASVTGDDLVVDDKHSNIPLGSNCFLYEMPPGSAYEGVTAPVNLTDPSSFTWRTSIEYYATNASGDGDQDSEVSNSGYSFVISAGGTDTTVVNTVDAIAQVEKTFTGTTQHLDANGAWDGTWDVAYTIKVTNPSTKAALSYGLVDTPSAPEKNTINSVTWTGPDRTSHVVGSADEPVEAGTAITMVSNLPEGATRIAGKWYTKDGAELVVRIPEGFTDDDKDGVYTKDGETTTYALDPRAQLAASAENAPSVHEYTVVLNVKAAEDGTGVAKPSDAACTAEAPGSSVDTIHNQADVTTNEATRTSEACGDIPDSPTFSVTKTNAGSDTVVSNGKGADGTFSYTSTYTVTVTNTSTTASKIFNDVTDALTLPTGATLTAATVKEGDGSATNLTPLDPSSWTLAKAGSGSELAAGTKDANGNVTGGGTRTFVVTVTFEVDPATTGYDSAAYQCAGNATDGYTAGIVNTAAMDEDTTTGDNTACQSLTPRLNVVKTIAEGDNGGLTGAATFDVTYTITATNDGALAQSTGVLTDTPAFAAGLTINAVKVATTKDGLDTATAATVENGAYKLTDGVVVDPGASQVFYVRANVTLNTAATGYSAANLACQTGGDGTYTTGHGLFNTVAMTNEAADASKTDNIACGPVGPRTITIFKTGTQPNGQANADGSYPLAGATFAIYDANPTATDFDGRQPVQTLANPDGTLTSFTTETLELGKTYWLVETKAPTGHNLLPTPVAFTLGKDDSGLTTITLVSGQNLGSTSITVANATGGDSPVAASISVKDTETGTLPLSGGNGIGVHVIWAAMLLAGSLGLVALNKTSRRKVRVRA
ncbi:DUF5979 domain-containing protein [Actinomyces radicidentis]|uniref:DUF5979 domain-containing protein n=1 Tax=Actinomyces radicidentis TaxID=111015 RepID=UPI0026DEDD36|nr:DUF5979 domain-containing protein [Actinomyces radicidentis]